MSITGLGRLDLHVSRRAPPRRAACRSSGVVVPDNDIWIAAVATCAAERSCRATGTSTSSAERVVGIWRGVPDPGRVVEPGDNLGLQIEGLGRGRDADVSKPVIVWWHPGQEKPVRPWVVPRCMRDPHEHHSRPLRRLEVLRHVACGSVRPPRRSSRALTSARHSATGRIARLSSTTGRPASSRSASAPRVRPLLSGLYGVRGGRRLAPGSRPGSTQGGGGVIAGAGHQAPLLGGWHCSPLGGL